MTGHQDERLRSGFPDTVMVVPTESGKMADTQSEVTDSTRSDDGVYKRKYKDLMAIISKQESIISKQQSKRAKKIKEKRVKKKIKDIPEELRLGVTQKYQLGRFTKQIVWKSVKFWHEELETKAVKKALKHLDIKKPDERIKLRDFVSAFMEESIIMKRNNTIGAMKKLVCKQSQRDSKCTTKEDAMKKCYHSFRLILHVGFLGRVRIAPAIQHMGRCHAGSYECSKG